ncbi:unnamed protein product [marine sediment metagenome]|uniref:Uncharacterized protein n=1 Tax=marine sediment metagenome TaxID=412755 RepID=X1CC56_9ZZZZ
MGMSKKTLYKLAGFKPGDRVRETDVTYHFITDERQQAEGVVLKVMNFTTAAYGGKPSGIQVFVQFDKGTEHPPEHPYHLCYYLPPSGLELMD